MNILNNKNIKPIEFRLISKGYFNIGLLVFTLSFFFGYMGYILEDKDASLFVFQNAAIIILLVFFWVFTVRSTRRVIIIYFTYLIGNSLWILLLWEAAYILSNDALIMNIGILAYVLAFINRSQILRKKLKLARKVNQESGRLDLKNGLYNFSNPFHFDTPDNTEKMKRSVQGIGRIIYPLGPFIGYLISRTLGHTPTIWPLLFFMFTYVGLLIGATYMAVILDLLEIEKDIGRKIMVPTINNCDNV